MADSAGEPALQPSRIKRNTACTACRDAKVRFDKTHKRVSRRSKLEELAQEIQSIKQSVGSSTSSPSININAVLGPAQRNAPNLASSRRHLGIPSPSASTGMIEANAAASTPATSLAQDTTVEQSFPRVLGSYPFSGEDIDYYFQKFFDCYHSYMPVVRQRDPNKCFESCPFLFWTIIYIASRRYAKSSSLLPFLAEEIQKWALSSIVEMPLSLSTINALILLCTWIFPAVRFVKDYSVLFSSIMGTAALLLGIHTGRGAHPEYSHGIYTNSYTDEEATYTWAGINIVSQRVASYLGIPPLSCLFNQTIQNTIDGRMSFHVPSSFRVLLECQKFCNRVHKLVGASLEESTGVSTHLIQVLEDEWTVVSSIPLEYQRTDLNVQDFAGYQIQGIICSERAADLDKFNALLVQLEIQMFYLMPPAGHDPQVLKQHVLRTYHTASAVFRDALELDKKMGFLSHVTHPQVRSIATASCVIFKTLRLSNMEFLDRKLIGETAATDAITVCQRAIVTEGDLPARLSTLLGALFEFTRPNANPPWHEDQPVATSFPHRLAASVTFDCFIGWKKDGALRSLYEQQQKQQQQQAPLSSPANKSGDCVDPMLASAVPDVSAMDWSFMDDFNFNWTTAVMDPPVMLWPGMAS
ncbi:hypothetical protein GGR57DRAFT_496385 [Xylariaceae sp. FL1272]|nr:hypothetical protein GGR57DRAFT_496385 [Xylariaceae sp. FL1272]